MNKYRINQIKTNIDESLEDVIAYTAKAVGIKVSDISSWEIRKRSTDSRKKPYIQFVYTVNFVTSRKLRTAKIKNLSVVDEAAEKQLPPAFGTEKLIGRPVVIGIGPCGLFAGLELAKLGYRPIVLERGPAMSERIEAVETFRREGRLDPEANMLYGEGGAGTFSDGKIGTGIKDGLIRDVLGAFRDAGAGDDIMYLAKPHIGTDVLRTVIVNLRNQIIELGGEVRFNTKLESFSVEEGRLTGINVKTTLHNKSDIDVKFTLHDDIDYNVKTTLHNDIDYDVKTTLHHIDTNALVLAIGHSARDTFKVLKDTGFDMQQKPFSIGVRMEHPQAMIDESQYGKENVGKLPPADYRLAYKASNGRGVYSFCMCPGGEVVVCSTKDGELCVNGMSNRKRDSGTANSGILCDVRTEDFGSDDVLAGVWFQEKYERLAYINGGSNFKAPSCKMGEFLEGESDEAKRVINSLPEFASEALREAVPDFGRKINGYDSPDAVVTGVETRSSSPIRIVRNESGMSNIDGVFPAGEGAGYAGGITSAACDGIRAAWHIVERFAPQ